MKKNLSILTPVVSFLTVFSASQSLAAEAQWEIWTGPLASVNLYTANSSSTSVGTTDVRFFSMTNLAGPSAGVGRILDNDLEVKLSPSYFSSATQGTTLAVLQLTAGLNYSFMVPFEDAFFAEAQAGIYAQTISNTTDTHFAWLVSVGKRFSLVSHISWTPQITYISVSQSGIASSNPGPNVNFSIIPVQLSLLL